MFVSTIGAYIRGSYEGHISMYIYRSEGANTGHTFVCIIGP